MKVELKFQGEKFWRERGRALKDMHDAGEKKTGKKLLNLY